MRILSALVATAVLSGCVPFPNFRYFAPAVAGVVTRAGVPVEGATVVVSAKFSEEIATSTTGTAGEFAAQPIRKLLLTATLIGDPLSAYSVVITAEGKRYTGYVESTVGYSPKNLSLACELGQPVVGRAEPTYCSPSSVDR